VRGSVRLASLLQKTLSVSTGWKQTRFLVQVPHTIQQALFERFGLFETTTQHDTTSCLRVLIRRVQQFQS
jgi:hypothetical protein